MPAADSDSIEPPEVASVRPGEILDWDALGAYLRTQLPERFADPITILQFPNGSANLTYLLRCGAEEYVLRRPPFGVIAPGAHDMKREYKVLSRLWHVFDRAPRAYLFCDDHAVLGSDFFVMERRTGQVVRTVIPASMRHHPDVGKRIGLALTDAMAEMHLLDPAACDLSDLGKPEGFVARQIAGWSKRWDLVRPEPGGERQPAVQLMDELAGQLLAFQPVMTRSSIVHNDLKLDNCQFDPADPDRVKSIFDWDMATLGDPLIDLGTLVQYWPEGTDGPDGEVTSVADPSQIFLPSLATMGLSSREEIIHRYAERTGFDVDHIWWWVAFAYWKTGVVVEQLYSRWARGESTDDRMAQMAPRLAGLAAGAVSALDRYRPGR